MAEIVTHEWDEIAAAMVGPEEWARVSLTAYGDRLRTYAKRAATALGVVSDATLAQQHEAARIALRNHLRRL